uniref:Uncharacterized protein n=1 Tax=Anguilla anguilla TaxID=7936 RepID=A0A0E9SEG6_ANGAN
MHVALRRLWEMQPRFFEVNSRIHSCNARHSDNLHLPFCRTTHCHSVIEVP